MGNLADLEIGLTLDKSKYSSGLDDVAREATSKSNGIKAAFGGAFGVFTGGALLAGVGAVASGVGSFLSESFAGATEAQAAFAGVEQIIESTGGAAGVTAEQAAELASSLSAAAGQSMFGDESILAAEQVILRFSNIKDEVFPGVMQAAVDMATAMGTEPAAAAAMLGKALDDPANAAAKLKRAGVALNEEQQAMIEKMTAAGDVAGAQGVILDALGQKFGGQALASAQTFGGTMATIQDRIGEAQEGIGNALMPALTMLAAWFASPAAGEAINTFANIIGVVLTGAITFLTGTVLPSLMTAFSALSVAFTFLTTNADIIAPVMIAIGTAILVTTIPAFTAWAAAAWATATANIAAITPILPLLLLVGAAAAVLALAWRNNWGDIQGKTAAVVGFFQNTIWPWLQSAFNTVTAVLLPALRVAWDVVWSAVQAATSAVYNFLKGTVWAWLEGTAFPWITGTGLPAVQVAFAVVWAAIQAAVNAVYTFFSTVVWPWLNTAFSWVTGTGLPAVQSAFSTAWAAISTAVRTVYTFFSDTVWPWINTAFSNVIAWLTPVQTKFDTAWAAIQLVVKTFYTYFQDTVVSNVDISLKNLITWMEDVRFKWDTAVGLIVDIVRKIDAGVDEARKYVDEHLEKIKGYLTLGWGLVETTVSGVWSKIGGFIKDPINAAKDAVNTAIGLIKGWVQSGIDKVNALIDAINAIPVIPDIPTIPGGSSASAYGVGAASSAVSTTRNGTTVNVTGIYRERGGMTISDEIALNAMLYSGKAT